LKLKLYRRTTSSFVLTLKKNYPSKMPKSRVLPLAFIFELIWSKVWSSQQCDRFFIVVRASDWAPLEWCPIRTLKQQSKQIWLLWWPDLDMKWKVDLMQIEFSLCTYLEIAILSDCIMWENLYFDKNYILYTSRFFFIFIEPEPKKGLLVQCVVLI